MFSVSSPHVAALTCLTTLVSLVSSHTVITYPGWRGDNLLKSGDILQEKGLGAGANQTYPYGMQWIYPCTQEFLSFKPGWTGVTHCLKAEVCPFRPIALSGQWPVVRSVSSLAGSAAIPLHFSTSIWAKAPLLKITHCQWYLSSKLKAQTTICTMAVFAYRKSPCQRALMLWLVIMLPSKWLRRRNMGLLCTM